MHSFWNAGPSEARFLNVHAPGCGFVEYLRSHASFDQHDPPEDGGRPATDAVVCGPGDGEVLELGPNRLLIKAGGDDADGAFYAGKMTIAPGFSGPPPHFHEHTLDSFFVLEGTLTVQIEGEAVEVPAGSFAVATPGTVHTFSNPGDDFVRAINFMGPGGFERYLKEAAAAGTLDPAVVGEILTRYDFVAA